MCENKTEQEYYTGVINDDQLTQRLSEAGVEFNQEIPDDSGMVLLNVLLTILPLAVFVIFFIWMSKKMSKGGGGIMGVGKSNAKMYVEKETGVTFKDVAGQDEAKESLQEVVDFLHNPGKYTGVGAKLPKGALLVGPLETQLVIKGETETVNFMEKALEVVEQLGLILFVTSVGFIAGPKFFGNFKS